MMSTRRPLRPDAVNSPLLVMQLFLTFAVGWLADQDRTEVALVRFVVKMGTMCGGLNAAIVLV